MAGGINDDYLQCMVFDDSTQTLIAAGKTNSNNFAPAQNDHGYIFALDTSGNWMWGNFFYNVSYAVSTVTGCKLSSNGTYLSIFGIANSLPIVMLLNKNDGSIKTFLTVATVQTYSTTPSFVTSQAFMYEETDPIDQKGYFYLSFTMNKILQIIKFASTSPYKLQWSIFYKASSIATPTASTYLPIHMMPDHKTEQEFYIVGAFDNKGGIMKPYRVTG
jgi:hypothetical protein